MIYFDLISGGGEKKSQTNSDPNKEILKLSQRGGGCRQEKEKKIPSAVKRITINSKKKKKQINKGVNKILGK